MTAATERFIARQAILDRNGSVYAYELFFRTGIENSFPRVDAELATSRVLADSFLVFGIEELTGDVPAFVNFPRGTLVSEQALLLPSDRVVVEILETVDPDPDVIEACARLKRHGFRLALDDFVLRPDYEPLLRLADIVKIDFRLTPGPERARLARRFLRRGLTLLAEKVETDAEFREAKRLGYAYFQGHFFSRPSILHRRDLSSSRAQYLRFLQELSAPELDFGALAGLIQSDISLSFKLLRYINSAAFGLRQPVASISHALRLLGEREVRRWASFLAMAELAGSKPAELLRLALTRARLCETLGTQAGLGTRTSDLFLLGLFSLLDAMLDRPLADILADLPLEADLRAALSERAGRMGAILRVAVDLEEGAWTRVPEAVAEAGLQEPALADAHLEAIRYADRIWRREEGQAADDATPAAGTGTDGP